MAQAHTVDMVVDFEMFGMDDTGDAALIYTSCGSVEQVHLFVAEGYQGHLTYVPGNEAGYRLWLAACKRGLEPVLLSSIYAGLLKGCKYRAGGSFSWDGGHTWETACGKEGVVTAALDSLEFWMRDGNRSVIQHLPNEIEGKAGSFPCTVLLTHGEGVWQKATLEIPTDRLCAPSVVLPNGSYYTSNTNGLHHDILSLCFPS